MFSNTDDITASIDTDFLKIDDITANIASYRLSQTLMTWQLANIPTCILKTDDITANIGTGFLNHW